MVWRVAWPGERSTNAEITQIKRTLALGSIALIAAAGTTVSADTRITECMYSGAGGELIESTNLSDAPVDMSGWSFDDDNFGGGAIGPFDLSGFGIVEPDEWVNLTEANAEVLRAAWSLIAEVKIVGDLGRGDGSSIGRNDEIDIFDADGELVDHLTYGDQDFPGTIRTQNISGDATGDGAVDLADLNLVLANFGQRCN
ncbi:MAG: lamin tail domain-containing protein [Phycisphaerales bacterium]